MNPSSHLPSSWLVLSNHGVSLTVFINETCSPIAVSQNGVHAENRSVVVRGEGVGVWVKWMKRVKKRYRLKAWGCNVQGKH